MKNKKHFKIPLVVYPFDLIFLFNHSDKEAEKALGDKWDDELMMTGCGKFLLNKECNLGIIRCNHQSAQLDSVDMGVLQHEILHAVSQILNYCGMPLTTSSEEAYAYLIEYVAREVFMKINQHKKWQKKRK